MSQITGDVTLLDAANKSPLQNKNVYINFDVLNSIPEQYQVVLSKVPINFDTDFYEVGDEMYMPQPHIIKRIADACGISLDFQEKNEQVFQEVDYNRILMAPIDAEPKMRKIVVGKSVTKIGSKKELDGTSRSSGACTDIYNVWERCCEEWSREEAKTNGYDPSIVKTWPSGDRYFIATWTKDGREQKKNIPLRYDTPYKRRSHFDGLIKFAHPICQTKAYSRVIRTITGIFLGYKKTDIPDGFLAFAKVIRSAEALKLDALARADALRHGIAPPAPTAMLFGPTSDPEDNFPDATEIPDIQEEVLEFTFTPPPEKPTSPKLTKREEFISVLSVYQLGSLVPFELTESAANILTWLHDDRGAETNKFWERSMNILRNIEKAIPEEGRVSHGLFG